MVGTNVATRQPPVQKFENYIFTRDVSSAAGLSKISDSLFTQVPGSAGVGGASRAISNVIPIGFNFSIDNITYKNFVANTSGWMALVQGSSFTASTIVGTTWENASINATFTSQSVLLAPWFDDLVNVANDPTQLLSANAGAIISSTQRTQ